MTLFNTMCLCLLVWTKGKDFIKPLKSVKNKLETAKDNFSWVVKQIKNKFACETLPEMFCVPLVVIMGNGGGAV